MPVNVVGTKIHTHIRTELKHSNGRLIEASKGISPASLSPVATLETFKAEFKFKRFTESYSNDLDGNTEYIVFRGYTTDDYLLTIHSFSCYCEPLNENQEPPF